MTSLKKHSNSSNKDRLLNLPTRSDIHKDYELIRRTLVKRKNKIMQNFDSSYQARSTKICSANKSPLPTLAGKSVQKSPFRKTSQFQSRHASSKMSKSFLGTLSTFKKDNSFELNEQNDKISQSRLFELKSRYSRCDRMMKGEIVEMRYGKALPKLYFQEGTKKEYKQRLLDILNNYPLLLFKIAKGEEVTDKEINEYFDLSQINFTWTQELENVYREICYNKISSNNIEFKNTYFLVNVGFYKLEKEVFEKKHLVTNATVNDKEIEEFYHIYEKIRELPQEIWQDAIISSDFVFIKKDKIVNNLLNKSRSKFYKNISTKYNREKKCQDELIKMYQKEEKKEDKAVRKVVVLNKIKYKEMTKNIKVSLKGFKNLQLRNRIATSVTSDFDNMNNIDRIKNSVLYKKVVINSYKRLKHRETYYTKMLKQGEISTKVVLLMVEKVQATFKAFMVRRSYKEIKKAMLTIEKHLKKYVLAKKMLMTVASGLGTMDNHTISMYLKIIFFRLGSVGLHLKAGDKEIIKCKFVEITKARSVEIPDVIPARKLAVFLEKLLETHIYGE